MPKPKLTSPSSKKPVRPNVLVFPCLFRLAPPSSKLHRFLRFLSLIGYNLEITLGRVLGRGGFCAVSEITNIKLCTKEETTVGNKMLDDEHAIHNIVQDRAFMQRYCLRGKKKGSRYALKRLQAAVSEDGQTFVNGVVDLAIEARFLAVIRHPNIIKMRAMAVTSPFSAEHSFFVVLDRLYDILGTRIDKWKKQKPKGMGKMLDLKGKKESLLWVERVAVAYDLSSALQYLHESKYAILVLSCSSFR